MKATESLSSLKSRVLAYFRANPKRLRQLGVAVGGLLLLVLLFRHWQYSKTPEYVRDRALHDLQIGDVQDLYSISCQDACQFLHITPENARYILSQTLWARGFPQDPVFEPFGPVPEDVKQWRVTFKRPHYAHSQSMGMLILERPNGKWCFDLPMQLEMACSMTNKSYAALARQLGITGTEYANNYFDLKGNSLSMDRIPTQSPSSTP